MKATNNEICLHDITNCGKSLGSKDVNIFLDNIKKDDLKFLKATKKYVNIIKSIEDETLPSEAYSEQIILENIANKNMINYILFWRGECVGYTCCSYFGDEAELLKICVKNVYQHKGFGNILLNKLINKLKTLKIENIFLEVREDNTNAINFYIKNHFNKISERKKYYKDGTNALILKYNIL